MSDGNEKQQEYIDGIPITPALDKRINDSMRLGGYKEDDPEKRRETFRIIRRTDQESQGVERGRGAA